MPGSRSLTAIDASEYELIEATMSESSRGRWFLQEYARRNRTADTEMLLGAIERLEGAVTAERAVPEPDRVDRMRTDLMDMANAIARTKLEIAAISAPQADQSRLGGASVALDAIVLATERATSDILEAAEHVQEAAWTLRETGSDTALCSELDRMATQIYTACSFQDLTAQRTARIIHTLRYLEERLGAMMAIWGDEPKDATGGGSPVEAAPEELCQTDVDRFIEMDRPAAAPTRGPKPALPEFETLGDELDFVDSPSVVDVDAGTDAEVSDVDAHAQAPVAAIVDQRQEAEDAFFDENETSGEEPADMMAVEGTDVATAFADIDAMTPEERMALFS